MEALKHLDIYDMRRWGPLEDIRCRECAHFRLTGCANAVVVLDAMRSHDNDQSMPIFDFTPDGDRRADQCPGMWPGEDYLAEIGLTVRDPQPVGDLPHVEPVSAELVADLGNAVEMLDKMIAANGGEAA